MLTSSTYGLITKGLGLPATRGLITMRYTLFVDPTNTPPITPPAFTGGGGGHIPVGGYRRGGAVNMRGTAPQPTRSVPLSYLTPVKHAGEPMKIITLRTTFGAGDKKIVKEYLAPKTNKVKVKLTGLFKAAKDTIKVVVEGLFNLINKEK